ncbi:DUF488 domain-containing protein [Kitasatospora kifunensis]|uniref:Uncharacterized protein YeaO (DUF488 family) n=1 Tax=Kitasatospora kifunensis TaxID=58351 RepID=A0A7W7R207_KITKI|nr:DUF488 family protein [Kitasatospora kifunensis]MBB4923764.1 uncharacterized protein YeaO (DUF488 family) [Kitasatospora kifunensis]
MPSRHPTRVRARRIYDPPEPADGYRVLVDRLWPRGISKERAALDEWAKDLAPSTELRRWLHQAPEEREAEFAHRYRLELDTPEAHAHLAALHTHAPLTLLTANQNPDNRHTGVLLELLGGDGSGD